MRNLLCADLWRLFRAKWLYLAIACMTAFGVTFTIIQRYAMDYTVGLDRVIFLPMSFYGIVAAALVALFIGEDFSDGVIRNTIAGGTPRRDLYWSALIVSWTALIVVYLTSVLVTTILGFQMFENNVGVGEISFYVALGLCTCLAYGAIFTMITMLAANRNIAAVASMLLAFGMLFLCLHTNQVLAQKAIKDGLPNPAYADGIKRAIYEFLHDVNPTGQAAQLSSMQCLNAWRYVLTDVGWVLISVVVGVPVFQRKDLR